MITKKLINAFNFNSLDKYTLTFVKRKSMTEKMKTFTVVIGNAAYTSERPYTMLRFAYTSLLEGHKINIFLVEDGVFVGKKNQNPSTYDNVEKWLRDVLEEGGIVKACGVCTKARGVSAEELIEGIEVTTMNGFVDMCVEADNILFS